MVDFLRESLKDAQLELLKELFYEGRIKIEKGNKGILVIIDNDLVQER